jgi:hypothetical protein
VLATTAPVAWALSDAAVTGDLLYSLHSTRTLAETLDRPQSAHVALVALPQYLRFFVGTVPSAVGLAGVLAGVTLLYRASLPILGLGALGLTTFLALGPLGLPLLDRYLLVPALVLALFCGVAVAGWKRYNGSPLIRRAWIAVGIALAAGLLASVPATLNDISNSDRFTADRARVQASLERVLLQPRVRQAIRACPPVIVPDYRAVPLVIQALKLPPREVLVGGGSSHAFGADLAYASVDALEYFGTGQAATRVAPRLPRGARRVSAGRYWLVSVLCPRK